MDVPALGDGSKTLHVHHGYYAKGMAPWDYAEETLLTVCVDCHESAEVERQKLLYLSGQIARYAMFEEIDAYFRARAITTWGLDNAIVRIDGSWEAAKGVALAMGAGETLNTILERARETGHVSPCEIEAEQIEKYEAARR